MAKRSYGELCPLARTLDVVGERWTLLILRELLFGPKRYTDLIDGLPAIGPQVLAERLRHLRDAGLVERTRLPPPAASHVYQPTPRARELEPALRELARFGLPLAVEPAPGDHFRLGSYLMALRFESLDGPDAEVELRVEDEAFRARVRDGGLEVAEGGREPAAAAAVTDRETFLALVGGELELKAALEGGALALEGDGDAARRLLAALLAAAAPPA